MTMTAIAEDLHSAGFEVFDPSVFKHDYAVGRNRCSAGGWTTAVDCGPPLYIRRGGNGMPRSYCERHAQFFLKKQRDKAAMLGGNA